LEGNLFKTSQEADNLRASIDLCILAISNQKPNDWMCEISNLFWKNGNVKSINHKKGHVNGRVRQEQNKEYIHMKPDKLNKMVPG
jgi:hypothetical protein